jgi:ABC-type nitrate/sulfonate/bicarbonate transport system substrate-binding protein
VSGARPIQAMLGGSIDVSQVGGAATVAAAAQGAEVVILGTIFSRLNFAVHASPQIKQINDLKGKTLVTGTVGGNTYFAALLFLSRFNWVPNRDVHLIGVGGSPEVLGALTQGRFPAGVLTAPTTHMATRMGFREIFDLGSLDFPFPTLSVVSTRKYSESNPDVILSVLRATSEAIHLYKTRPEVALPGNRQVYAGAQRRSRSAPGSGNFRKALLRMACSQSAQYKTRLETGKRNGLYLYMNLARTATGLWTWTGTVTNLG